jgi:hypothetical protein
MKNDLNHHPISSSGEIAALMARFRASGMGLERFARTHGIPPGRLHYWLYQKHRGASFGRTSPPSKAERGPVFQEIKLPTRAPLLGNWAAEVSLPQGVAVRFSAGALPAWIGSVVQALQRPC